MITPVMNKRVAILAYSGCSLFELSCAVELFALPRPEIKGWYQAQVVSFEPNSLQSTAGVELNSVSRIESFAEFDLVIIPSWFTDLTLQPEYASSLIKNLVIFPKLTAK